MFIILYFQFLRSTEMSRFEPVFMGNWWEKN